MPFHGGLDWGGTSHAVCVIDAGGQVASRAAGSLVGQPDWRRSSIGCFRLSGAAFDG